MRRKISIIALCLIFGPFSSWSGADVTIHRSGSAVTFFQPGYEDYSLENSSYNNVGGILLGEGYDESKAVYRFYFPPPQDGQEVDSLTIFIYGTGDITNFLVGGYTWSTFPDSFSIGFTIDDIRDMLQSAGDSVGGDYLDVEIDVMSGLLGGERYDLEKIQVTYTYSGADNTALEHFHTAYSAYNAINNFKSDIVSGTWGLGAAPTDELIQRAVQKTGAFCQNLSGLDGNIVGATKSFFNALDSFYALVNLIEQQLDYLLFWGFYPTTGPTLAQIQTACDDAATACANLAIDYQNYGFDGSYSGGEAATILAKIQDVESKLNTLKVRLQSAANDMYSDGADSAKIAKQSMAPLMNYEENSMTLLDSYLPNLIDDITLQENQFVTVTINTSPSDKDLEVEVDSVQYTNGETFIWASGSSHTIGAPSPQIGNDSKTYGFVNWSDGGARVHAIAPTSDMTITAYYDTPPIPPSNFSHDGITTDSITWTWQDNSSDEDGFRGHDSSHNVKWTASANATSYTETGLSANVQYTRHVHAYNWVGDSGPSNSHLAYTAANPPAADSFSNVTTNSIQANWTANGNPPGTQYYCENITAGTNSGWTTDTSWDCGSLSPNTEYDFRTKARNGDDVESDYCSTQYQYTLANVPGVDYFSNRTSNSIQVNWTANGNPPGTEYYCENITNDANSGWTTQTSWICTGLSSGIPYSFQVKARSVEDIETEWINLGCTYGGGVGTPGDPYLIYTSEQMNAIGVNPADWDKHFLLTADIDLSGYTGTQFNIIGNDSNAFTGVFDGNGHTISNFTYESNETEHIGLFGHVRVGLGGNGEIKDLGLIDPNVIAAGSSLWVGSLVGYLENGTITGCCVEGGSVKGFVVTGGLVGCNYGGTISSCHSTCILSGGDADMGGLVGANWSTISNCYATGSVSGRNSESEGIGGLVGDNIGGMISNCYATGNVWGGDGSGGLVGVGEGMISNCYSTGKVSADGNRTGGLMGSYSSYNVFDTISNCYATGSVDGNDLVGGLVGRNGGTISNCYAVGDVNGINNIGGFIGFDDVGSYTSCFWDSDVNQDVNGIGNTSDPNVIGKTTTEMKAQSTFINAGWNFVDIWDICEATNYPKLIWSIPVADFICPDGVSMVDFSVLGAAWMSDPNQPNWNPICDISDPNDNFINELDLKVFTENWLW